MKSTSILTLCLVHDWEKWIGCSHTFSLGKMYAFEYFAHSFIFKCGIFQPHILIILDFAKIVALKSQHWSCYLTNKGWSFFSVSLIYWFIFHCDQHHHLHHIQMTFASVWVIVSVKCEMKGRSKSYFTHLSFIIVYLIVLFCSTFIIF